MTGDAVPPVRVSLREALGATPDPDFVVTLPEGWMRHDVSDASRDALTAQARSRLMRANRPDIYAAVRGHVQKAFDDLARESAVALFTQQRADEFVLPVSLIASHREAPAGATLDPLVRALIIEENATPLLGDPRVLRCEREARRTLDGDELWVSTIIYLTPIPGSQRRRGLQFTATIARPMDVATDDRPMGLMRSLLDMIVSSQRWLPVDTSN